MELLGYLQVAGAVVLAALVKVRVRFFAFFFVEHLDILWAKSECFMGQFRFVMRKSQLENTQFEWNFFIVHEKIRNIYLKRST